MSSQRLQRFIFGRLRGWDPDLLSVVPVSSECWLWSYAELPFYLVSSTLLVTMAMRIGAVTDCGGDDVVGGVDDRAYICTVTYGNEDGNECVDGDCHDSDTET